MARGVKRPPKQLSMEERLSAHVRVILDADKITPNMIYDLILDGATLHMLVVGDCLITWY